MAENWLHAPHVVLGEVEGDGIRIHHAGQVEDTERIYLCAEIVRTADGSAIVGEFKRGKFQWFCLNLLRFIITLFLLGLPTFTAYVVWKGGSTEVTPSLIAFIALPVVAWMVSLRPLRKWMAISPDDTRVVRAFLEQATQN